MTKDKDNSPEIGVDTAKDGGDKAVECVFVIVKQASKYDVVKVGGLRVGKVEPVGILLTETELKKDKRLSSNLEIVK